MASVSLQEMGSQALDLGNQLKDFDSRNGAKTQRYDLGETGGVSY
jgi:hypothetical protein